MGNIMTTRTILFSEYSRNFEVEFLKRPQPAPEREWSSSGEHDHSRSSIPKVELFGYFPRTAGLVTPELLRVRR